MKTHKIKFILGLFVLCFLTQACKRKGCTHANASNYSSDAKKDCGCCTYEGSMVFWIDKAESEYLVNNYGTKTLTFLVDGQRVATVSSSDYTDSSPSCGQAKAVTVVKDMGKSETATYLVSILDENDFPVYLEKINFKANTCLTQKIEF